MKIEVNIKLPNVPKFLRLEDNGINEHTMPLSKFSEAQLRELGAEWTEALVKASKVDPKTVSIR